MKKLFLIAAIAMTSVCAQAQVYVGGTLGFSTSSASLKPDGSPANFDFSGSSYAFRPEVGYKLDDKWSVGIQVGFSHGLTGMGNLSLSDIKGITTTLAGAVTEIAASDDLMDMVGYKVSINSFNIAPYARYTFFSSEYVDLFAEGMIGYSSLNPKVTGMVEAEDENGDPIYVGGEAVMEKQEIKPSLSMFEVCVRPGVAVKLSDNVRLTAKVGYLGYQTITGKVKDYEPVGNSKVTLNRFGLNLDGTNILFGAEFNF